MLNQILSYCEKQNIKCIFLDFFGTIVQRKCGPQEVKLLWAKKLSCKIKYTFDEKQLALLRTKSEQAAISRAENGEFNYTELADEIYRRAVELNRSFGDTYSLEEFYKQALTAEVEAELESQSYIQETIQLIDEAYDLGVNMYIISDFYLSKEELKTFLKRDRIDEKIDQIFVSSDYRNSKQQGGLYDCVCQTLGVNKDQCVMLGDNENSDVKNAEKSGIKGFLLNNSEGVYTKDNVKEKIKKIYPVSEKQMTVIGTGYNSEVFKKTGIKSSRKDGKIRMIFAGKITQKKGVKSLLRALNLLDYEKEKIQLILAGGAGNLVEYEEIKELADGCRYPVVFAGCVTQSRLAELYNDCDIFVLPSMYEGLPLTVIESLACGDRVVMTKLEGIAEWLADMVPDADIRYVLPPGMKGTDEPLEEELPEFESRLAEALREAIEEKDTKECDVSRISWQKIAREVIR